MKFRVLMRDNVVGFQFAIHVEGKNKIGSETLAQGGYTEVDGAKWDACSKAILEFPDSYIVECRHVVENSGMEFIQ